MRTTELIRRDISAYALIFPEVSFSLETMHGAKDGVRDKSNTRLLTVPKVQNTWLSDYVLILCSTDSDFLHLIDLPSSLWESPCNCEIDFLQHYRRLNIHTPFSSTSKRSMKVATK